MKTITAISIFASVMATSACSPNHTQATGWFGLQRQPAPGYEWAQPGAALAYAVKWHPGATAPGYPHAHAAELADHWTAEPGYAFANADNPGSATWQPGQRLERFPHAAAGKVEGQWEPDPGYRLAQASDPGSAKWEAGLSNALHPNIHSAEREGDWLPDAGWSWVSTRTDDLNVIRMQEADSMLTGQRDYSVVIVHTIAQECSQPAQDDGFWAGIGRVGCAVVAAGTTN